MSERKSPALPEFRHRGACCYGCLKGDDIERVYGANEVEVVSYGTWRWPSASIWLVAIATSPIEGVDSDTSPFARTR